MDILRTHLLEHSKLLSSLFFFLAHTCAENSCHPYEFLRICYKETAPPKSQTFEAWTATNHQETILNSDYPNSHLGHKPTTPSLVLPRLSLSVHDYGNLLPQSQQHHLANHAVIAVFISRQQPINPRVTTKKKTNNGSQEQSMPQSSKR